MNRFTRPFIALALTTLQAAAMAEPGDPSLPPPDESRVRLFTLVNTTVNTTKRGLTFEAPEGFPVEPRGVMSVIKLPTGSLLTIHAFGCAPDSSPLDPNFIVESLEPAISAALPGFRRLGPGKAIEHPAGRAARYRFAGTFGADASKQDAIALVYVLVDGASTAIFYSISPPSGELPSMEMMQPIFSTFTFKRKPQASAQPGVQTAATPPLANAVTLTTGASIAYPDGFTPSVDHFTVTLKPSGNAPGPTITVVDRLHGDLAHAAAIVALLPELQSEHPSFARLEDPVVGPSSYSVRLSGQVDQQRRDVVMRAVLNGKRTLRLVLEGTPEEVAAAEPLLQRIINDSIWPAPAK